jgi:3-oxoacyl-[acyl-carrier protein] reductase
LDDQLRSGDMELGLSGKRALITGSTKGIGRAIVETLLDEGASVALCSRTADDVDAAVKELSERGKVFGAVCDAADADAVRGWVNASAEALGGIDIFVHNTSGKPARKLDGWQNNFDIDLMSLVHAVDEAGEQLADGGGAVVSIGTTAVAEHFASGSGSYSALKAAVTNWTLGQAQVLGAKGVRCNVVSPGPIFIEGGDWDMIKNHMADFYAASQANHPQGDLGTAQDVADAVTFLVSDRAKHINGVNLTVDGGFLKRVNY